MPEDDVIVVGAGNAALAAAVSAREQGAGRIVVLEKAPPELRGGNTHYSGGLFRFAFDRAVGGLFHVNYPGGTGLRSGAVFGRLAGANAAGA
jgi:succinate dehydrogenase/fumarate reductase flavoprotein subunit